MVLIAFSYGAFWLALQASPNGPGFIVWGLFATFALLVAGYAIWMVRIERAEAQTSSLAGPESERREPEDGSS